MESRAREMDLRAQGFLAPGWKASCGRRKGAGTGKGEDKVAVESTAEGRASYGRAGGGKRCRWEFPENGGRIATLHHQRNTGAGPRPGRLSRGQCDRRISG